MKTHPDGGDARLTRGALAAACALIFLLSSRADYPSLSSWWPAWLPEPSYFVHFGLYSALALVAWLDFRIERLQLIARRPMLTAILFTAVYGASDELHQRFVPGRSCDISDLAVDAASACVAMLSVKVYLKMKDRKKIGNKDREVMEEGNRA